MKQFNKVAIVGVGLIGGSIGAALLKRRLAREVVGIGRRRESLETAKRLGTVTAISTDLAQGVLAAELVVVCTPPGRIAEDVCQAAAACRQPKWITDAGSTKQQIVEQIAQTRQQTAWPPGVRFVGSHPLAGSEQRGAEHSSADLFEGRTVVVTPGADSAVADVEVIGDFWRSLGARVVQMEPGEHDRAVAATSHLPHLVASAVAAGTPKEYVTLTAGGWLDTTRIAAGDPSLWQQIFSSNRASVLLALAEFERRLAELRAALTAEDAPGLEQLLAEAKHIRDAVGS